MIFSWLTGAVNMVISGQNSGQVSQKVIEAQNGLLLVCHLGCFSLLYQKCYHILSVISQLTNQLS